MSGHPVERRRRISSVWPRVPAWWLALVALCWVYTLIQLATARMDLAVCINERIAISNMVLEPAWGARLR